MYYIGCFEIEKHLANVIAEELIDALNEHVPPYGTYTKLNDTMHLQVGDHAPAFTGKDQEEKTIQLADFAGKKLVLYFYPKDNTPGCTAQACNLRDNYQALQQAGYEVVGVSTDSEQSHQKFIANKQLPFRLIADKDHQIHEQYGTWVQKSMFGKKYWGTARVTFIIDEHGKIEQIIDQVKTGNHTAQILPKLR